LAVAYCVRHSHHPTVSCPLEWKEVNNKLNPLDFTIITMPSRLKKKGDLWKGLFEPKVSAKNSIILLNLVS
jgi:bifunctional non-homologous end joining protein LigD